MSRSYPAYVVGNAARWMEAVRALRPACLLHGMLWGGCGKLVELQLIGG